MHGVCGSRCGAESHSDYADHLAYRQICIRSLTPGLLCDAEERERARSDDSVIVAAAWRQFPNQAPDRAHWCRFSSARTGDRLRSAGDGSVRTSNEVVTGNNAFSGKRRLRAGRGTISSRARCRAGQTTGEVRCEHSRMIVGFLGLLLIVLVSRIAVPVCSFADDDNTGKKASDPPAKTGCGKIASPAPLTERDDTPRSVGRNSKGACAELESRPVRLWSPQPQRRPAASSSSLTSPSAATSNIGPASAPKVKLL